MIVGPIQFDRPVWLLLAPLMWLLFWLIARRSLAGLGGTARHAAFVLRVVVTGLIAGAMAEPEIRRESKDVSLLVVLDQSASMPSDTRAAAGAFLSEASGDAAPTDRLGIVSAGSEARARVLPSAAVSARASIEDSLVEGAIEPVGRDGTDLADGVRMAMAIKPEDSAARIVLISDGNETEGNVLGAAERARAARIPIDVVPVEREAGSEVVFEELATPAYGRKGQTVDVHARLRATAPTRGVLTLLVDDVPLDLTPGEAGSGLVIDLEAGDNPLTIPVELTRGGATQFRAVFEPLEESGDRIGANNEALSVTFVSSEGRVRIYTNDPLIARPMGEALRRARIDVEVHPPRDGHRSKEELADFDAVVLYDVPARDFTRRQQEQLASYVEDGGGGLVMVGGPDSFGAGGWIGTPIADVLPVKLDPPQERQIPRGALAIVLDSSGSMMSPVGTSGLTQQQVAARAALEAVRSLSRLDLVTVVTFDSMARVRVPLQPNENPEGIENEILRVGPGGGTNMYEGMREAVRQLAPANRSVKHVILLTDGQSTGTINDGYSIVRDMNAQQITMSTIAVGDGADARTLATLAQAAGGQGHVVSMANQVAQLPQIFMKEARMVQRPLIWEGEAFRPELTGAPSPAMGGMPSALPPITGYVITAERDGLSTITARVPGEHPDPIVAQWQHGLGRVVAFTGDATSRWSDAWMSWGGFDTFWEQHLRWAMRPTGSSNVSVSTRTDGSQTRVLVTALDDRGEPLNFARFRARVVGPEMDASDLAMLQTGPGRYEGAFESSGAGSHLVTMAYEAGGAGGGGGGGDVGIVQAAVTRPFADEHRALTDNAALLRRVAEMTGGRVWDGSAGGGLFSRAGLEMPVSLRPIWLAVALAAMGLFLADVAVRRVRIDARAMMRATRGAISKTRAKSEAQVGALRAAREATTRRLADQRESEPADDSAAPLTKQETKIAKQAAKARAGAKFEASEDEVRAGGRAILDAAPAPKPERRRASGEDADEEEAGMSRLMRAKQRARQGIKDSENDER